MTTTSPVALVTGASSGIGKAATRTLVDAGFRVIGTSRDTSRSTPGGGVTFLDLDVTGDESVTDVVAQVIARFGRLDVLVNNAGVYTPFDANLVKADTPLPVYAHRRRYPAGSTAGRVAVLRRVVPARMFDRSIRKLNRMAG